MSRQTSCGIAELFPVRFEYVLGLFIALKKQIDEENKQREKQEKEQSGSIDVNNQINQANSMVRQAQGNFRVPNMPSGTSMPSVSMPSMPHL